MRDGVTFVEAKRLWEHVFSQPHFAVGVEQTLIIVVSDTASILHLTQHVAHSVPAHSLWCTCTDADPQVQFQLDYSKKGIDVGRIPVMYSYTVEPSTVHEVHTLCRWTDTGRGDTVV